MYSKYAYEGGFGVRKSTQKRKRDMSITMKYLLCFKAGTPEDINVDTTNEDEESDKTIRNVNLQITGCRAFVIFELVNGTNLFRVKNFEEKHNHMLLPDEYKHLSRKERQLAYSEQLYVHKASTSGMGATKAHNLLTSIRGSSTLVHGTTVDFKNFRRDINCFIGDSDSQMLINKMESRRKCVPDFTFKFKVVNSELVGLFWSDEVAKCNIKEFGDIVSFDATFQTNK